MPIDPSISLQIKPPQFMSPQQAISLQQLARQGQIQQLALTEAQQDQQQRNAMLQVMRDPTSIDPQTGTVTPQGIAKLTQVNPEVGMKAARTRQLTLAQLGEIRNKQFEAENKWRNELVSEYAPEIVTGYEREVAASGAEVADRNFRMRLSDSLSEARKSGRYAPEFLDKMEKQIASITPINLRSSLMHANPQWATEERERKGKPTNFERELVAAGYKPGTPEYERQLKKRIARETAPTQTMISLTGMGTLSPDALTLAVDQYLAGDSTAAQGYARNAAMKAQFMNRLAQRAKERGMTGADVASRVAEFQGIKAGERSLGTRQALVDMAVTEAQNMAPLALTASKNVKRTDYPTLNKVILSAEKGIGDENVVRLGIAVNSLINIYARAINPTGVPTQSDKEHARELLSSAWSKGQMEAGVDQLMKEMAAAKASPGMVREDMRGAVTGRGKESPTTGWSDEKERRYQELLRKRNAAQ